jgi:integrase
VVSVLFPYGFSRSTAKGYAMSKIDTVGARSKLAVRREPYWSKLGVGQYIGFRATGGGAGTWTARIKMPEGQRYQAFGEIDAAGTYQFEIACEKAREWFKHVGAGGSTQDPTVADLVKAYLQHVSDTKSDDAWLDAHSRLERLLMRDKLATRVARKLTKADFEELRQRLTKGKSESTAQRDLTAVRAVFNRAVATDTLTTKTPFAQALKAPKITTRIKRDLVVSREEIERICEHAPDDLQKLIRFLALLPIRPGAAAELNVGDWNGVSLVIRSDKAGENRSITPGRELKTMLVELTKDRLPNTPLLAREGGNRWNKDSWKYPVKAAAISAGIGLVARAEITSIGEARKTKARQELDARKHETRFTLYTLRHTGITQLAGAGVPLLTIAQLAGTSVQMIQQHYGHLEPNKSSAALDLLSGT